MFTFKNKKKVNFPLWLQVSLRMDFKMLLITLLKAHHGLTPSFIAELLLQLWVRVQPQILGHKVD